MPEKVVVTGASGHIGFHVAQELQMQGFDVHLIVRSENVNVQRLRSKGAVIHRADLFHPEDYRMVFHGATVLFHLAAENTTDTSDEPRVIRNTLDLTRTVLTAAIESGIKTIIYTSSVVVLGRSSDPNVLRTEKDRNLYPESPYVKGKMLAEDLCDSFVRQGHDIRRVYPSWVIGSDNAQLTPPHVLIQKALLNGQPFTFDGGISIASVQEVAKAHVAAWSKGIPRSQYVLGGANITFSTLYSTLAAITGRSQPVVLIPKIFISLGAVVAKFILGNRSPIDPEYVDSIIGKFSWYDSTNAVRELGYTIPPVEETLRNGVNEVRYHLSGLTNIREKNGPQLAERRTYQNDDLLLITGFPGWLANRMVDVLLNGDTNGKYAVDRKIRLLVQPSFRSYRFDLPDSVEIVYGDLKDKQSVTDALAGVKAVYHCAGVIYPPKIQTLYDVNWLGTKNLVDACIECGVKRIISMGTDSICGYSEGKRIFDENEPSNPYKNYGRSKFLAEQYLLQKTKEGFIHGTSLRGFWFFGPHMPLRNQSLIQMMRWNRQIIFGTGKNIRSLTHIDNVIQAFLKSEKSTNTIGKWYWISDKDPFTTIDQIFSTMAAKMGLTYRPIYIPDIVCSLLSGVDILLGYFGLLNATIHAAGKFNKDIAGHHLAAVRDFGYEPIGTFDHFLQDIEHFYRKS